MARIRNYSAWIYLLPDMAYDVMGHKGHVSDAHEIATGDTRESIDKAMDKMYPYAIHTGVSMRSTPITVATVNSSFSPNEYESRTARNKIAAYDYMQAMNLQAVTPLTEMIYLMADVYIVPRVGLVIVWDNNVKPWSHHKRYTNLRATSDSLRLSDTANNRNRA